MSVIGYPLLRAGLALTQRRAFRRLLTAATDPDAVQEALLLALLAENADTAFGKQHGFERIASAAEYRRAVPVATYEDLRERIEHQERSGEPSLTRQRPIYYNRTSGTVAAPKHIPVTAAGLAAIRAQRRLAAYALGRMPGLLTGQVFAVTGQAVEGKLPGGTPYGSMSGLLYRHQPALLRSRHVLPAELSAIDDYEAQYLAMATYGVAEPAVSCVGTANASTLLRLLAVINDHAETVLRGVAQGCLPDGIHHVGPRANPRRATALRRKLDASDRLTYADIWPRLAGVVAWKGGSCGVAIGNLRPALPTPCKALELGYIASEVHGTINVEPGGDVCLPALTDTFFEFVERDAWEAGDTRTLCLGELQVGCDYYVLVTTRDGLYRYDMNDIVRVTGRVGATPTFQFAQKGKGVTSITGEKLYEGQVLDAVAVVLAALRVHTPFYIMLADRNQAVYTLYLEALEAALETDGLALALDRQLQTVNIEYAGKRASGRLAPLRVRPLPIGAGERYRAHRVAAGQREAQFKYLVLQYADECTFDFAAAAALAAN